MTAIARSKAGELGRWLPGLLVSLVAIGLLLKLADWQEVLKAISLVEISLLIPAILFYLAGVFFRALTWRTLLLNKATIKRTFLTLNEGYLLNNVFPFRLGEIGRVLLLSQSSNLSAFYVFSTIVIERAYDLVIAASLLLATVPMVFDVASAQAVAYGVAGAAGVGMVCMYFLARYRDRIRVKLEGIGKTNRFYQERILPWLDSLLGGLEVLTRIDRFLLSVLFILLSWSFGAIEIHLLIAGFGISAPWWWTGFALGVVSLGIALPSAPASLGVYEAAMVGALALLGIPASQALAIAIIAHVIHITSTGVIGGIALFRDGQTLSGIYQRLRTVRLVRNP